MHHLLRNSTHQSLAASLDGNSQRIAKRPGEDGGAAEKPVRLPEREKGLFACAVYASDAIEVDLNRALGWATLGECLGKTFSPLGDQLPFEDNFGSVSEIEHRRS